MKHKRQTVLILIIVFASLVSPLGAVPAQASSLQPSAGGEGAVRSELGPPCRQMDSGLWPSLSAPLGLEPYDLPAFPSEAASPAKPSPQPKSAGQTIALPFDFSLSPPAAPPLRPLLQPPAPDLSLDKRSQVSRGGIIVYPGDTIIYTVCYSNTNDGTLANSVFITDFIPANTTYVSGSVVTNGTQVQFYTGTAWQPAEPTLVAGLRWIVGDLPADGNHCVGFQVDVNMTIVTGAGDSAMTLQYTTAVSPTATVTPTVSMVPTAMTARTQSPIVVQQLPTSGITNTATIDSDDAEPESDEVYNPFPDVALVDPVIGKIATPPDALPGHEVTFTLTVRNQGIAQAQNVRVTDTVPGFLEILDVIVTPSRPSSILPGNVVVVDIGTLDPYGTEVVTIIITARVRPGTPAGTLMDNWAVVTCDGGEDQDDATVQVPPEPAGEVEFVPQPGTITLLGSGLAALAGYATLRWRGKDEEQE